MWMHADPRLAANLNKLDQAVVILSHPCSCEAANVEGLDAGRWGRTINERELANASS